jgi:poly(3-hydroxyalkanoate) depolymerase
VNIGTIDIDGQVIRVAVRRGLAPNPVPLLFFNGIGASLDLIQTFIEALDPEIEVITFDVPGVGGSPDPTFPFRFSGLAKLTTKILDHFNYGKVDVIGISWGGFLAQQFAHDYPQRCRKLILAATSSGFLAVPPSLKVLALMSNPKRYTDSEYSAKIAPDIYGGQFRTNPELAVEHAKKMQSKTSSSTVGYYYQVSAVYYWSSIFWLHRIKQPTLVLAGNDDPLIPLANMNFIAGRIPNSELHVFDDGHLFLLTDLDASVPLIEKFLEAA